MNTLYLKAGREKSVLAHHPWIFSGAVERVEGDPKAGENLRVASAKGDFLAWAAYNYLSQIRGRIWSWDEHEKIDEEFIGKKVAGALGYRKNVIPYGETDAMRLVHAESDGLPGFVVDRYADVLVMQCLTAGADYWRDALANQLTEQTGIQDIFERSDVDVRKLEGLQERVGIIRGKEPVIPIVIHENEIAFEVDIVNGQKTGFYIDQRRNRAQVGALVAGRDVLNCFCYTGGFSLYAQNGGAKSIESVDSSANALALAKRNWSLNDIEPSYSKWVEADVFQYLRLLRDQARSFDAIVLDPPKFAPTAALAERAARGYKDINLLAFKLLRPGGLLFTFSCSGGITADLFQKIIAGAALDAGVGTRILGHFFQGADHPVALNFPEGSYLKGLIVEVDK